MNKYGMSDSEIKELRDFIEDKVRSFMLIFVFLRDEIYVPIIVWPGDTIDNLLYNYEHKNICDIGAIYIFKETPRIIKEMREDYCDRKLDQDGIWTYFMCSSMMSSTEIVQYGHPNILFFGKNSQGIFEEIDGELISLKDIDDKELEEYWGNDEPDLISDFLS